MRAFVFLLMSLSPFICILWFNTYIACHILFVFGLATRKGKAEATVSPFGWETQVSFGHHDTLFEWILDLSHHHHSKQCCTKCHIDSESFGGKDYERLDLFDYFIYLSYL